MKYRILLIEDDLVDQMAFKRFVKEEGFEHDFTIVSSVSEARKALDTGKFDIVVTDFLLGDGTALDVLGMLHDIPSLVVTGVGNEEVAVKAMKAGAYDYIIKDPENAHLKILPVSIDKIIERSKAVREFRMLSHALRNVHDSVFITDMNNKIQFVNDTFCKTYGYREEEVSGMVGTVLGKIDKEGEFTHRRKDGSEFPVVLTVSSIKDESLKESAIVRIAHNITERKLMENELIKLATIDRLTKAYNRVKFDEIFLRERERAKRYGKPLSMIMFDIDDFKMVNDTCGHIIGDSILRTISDLIRSNIRKLEYLIRWGGEEFMILAADTDQEKVEALAERIRSVIENYSFDKGNRITVSIGVAQFRKDDTEDSFIKRADDALYQAKNKGKNRVEVGL